MLNSCSFSKSEPYFGDIDQTDLCMILCLFLRVVQYSQIDSIGVSGEEKGLYWYQWYDWYQWKRTIVHWYQWYDWYQWKSTLVQWFYW